MATGGSDRRVKIWDISKNVCELKTTLSGSNGAITSIDYEAGASLILAASTDFASRVWSIGKDIFVCFVCFDSILRIFFILSGLNYGITSLDY